MKNNKIKEKISVSFAKKPEKVIFLGLILINLLLIIVSALVLCLCFPTPAGQRFSFWGTVYHVITMMLDAGCIDSLVGEDPTQNSLKAIICIVVILISMLIFTGAVIGYLTNIISNIFESSKLGTNRLKISNHTVLINWNSRASEIINDLLYSDHDEKVVVLVSENSEQIKQEISNRISDTKERERQEVVKEANELFEKGEISGIGKHHYIRKHLKKYADVTVIVRQGETYSLKQLNDISLLEAKTVIILSKDERGGLCKFDTKNRLEKVEQGNTNTIKTLIQVAQITSDESSRDAQKIVVEVEDDWTLALVNKVIKQKQKEKKCIIVPILVNRVLGQILSQFSIMPELNSVYSELFSNNGLTFYSKTFAPDVDENAYFSKFLDTHAKAIPITTINLEKKREFYYVAEKSDDYEVKTELRPAKADIALNAKYQFEKKHIAILGHNSKSRDVMRGFISFINEWDENHQLIDLLIIDDKEHLEKMDYYREFREYLSMRIVEADVYDKDVIVNEINDYIDSNYEDTSILILSDDYVREEEVDAASLTYLIYVQDIISEKIRQSEQGLIERFNQNSVDVVIELINPKNYDVARSYSANNVIISNRYISRMIVQLGDKEEIYSFYKDILTYDEGVEGDAYESKELYIKFADRFFSKDTVFPIKATPSDLLRTVYALSPENNKSMLLGYSHNGKNELFLNDVNHEITINAEDKLILFSPH